MEWTPIPPKVMVSVCLDIFHMPLVEFQKVKYNSMALCVDRHSGWIVAVPGYKQGLTGAKVAQAMLEHQWRPFGIPSVITSDQGSHFVNSWWQHMCGVLGIRHAVSHAYHHRANGRAERAGQQVIEKCRAF